MSRPARCVAMSQLIFSPSAEATAAAAECSHEEEQTRMATRSSLVKAWAYLCKLDLYTNSKGLDSSCLPFPKHKGGGDRFSQVEISAHQIPDQTFTET